jgi:protein-disulfide isomerase
MRQIFIFSLFLFIFSSCEDKVNFDSGANKHIEEYTKQKQDCEKVNIKNNETSQLAEQDKSYDLKPIQESTIEKIPAQEEAKDSIIIDPNIDSKDSGHKPDNIAPAESSSSTILKEDEGRKLISDYSKYDIVLGDRNAKVQVIQYSSATCAHCAYYNSVVFNHIKAKYIDTNKIAYVIREFISNRQDKDAAILCHCAGKDRFLQFMNTLYSTQSSWAYSANYLDNLINIGKIGGVSEEQYKKCLDDKALLDGLIALTIELAKDPRVDGTPVFFINGKLNQKPYSEKELSKAIDLELVKSQNEKT